MVHNFAWLSSILTENNVSIRMFALESPALGSILRSSSSLLLHQDQVLSTLLDICHTTPACNHRPTIPTSDIASRHFQVVFAYTLIPTALLNNIEHHKLALAQRQLPNWPLKTAHRRGRISLLSNKVPETQPHLPTSSQHYHQPPPIPQ